MSRSVPSRFPVLLALAAGLLVAGAAARAADPDAPAEITVGTRVIAPNPQRFGANVNNSLEGHFLNNFVQGGAFEPYTHRRLFTATGGGADYILNESDEGTSFWNVVGDGFFDGGTVRVYRIVDGAVVKVRESRILRYGARGWDQVADRLAAPRITLAPGFPDYFRNGVTWHFAVRAVDGNGNRSAYSGDAAATPLETLPAGPPVTEYERAADPAARDGDDRTAPAPPTGLTAEAHNGSVTLAWEPSPDADVAWYEIHMSRWPAAEHAQRIDLDKQGPAVERGDRYIVDFTATNYPAAKLHDRMHWFRGVDAFQLDRENPALSLVRDDTTRAPQEGGRSCGKLTAADGSTFALEQYLFSKPSEHWYAKLTPGRTYRAEAWLKQEGLAKPEVALCLTGDYSAVTHDFTVTPEWQRLSFDFVAPEYIPGDNLACLQLRFEGPGTLWVDNLALYDPTLPIGAPVTEATEALAAYRPGTLRTWCLDTDSTLENATNPETINGMKGLEGLTTANEMHLPTVLAWCKETGANPWIIASPLLDETEWAGLVDYLAGNPATAYGEKRAGQRDTPRTWIDEFDTIYIEFNNESWNFAGPYIRLDPEEYGRFCTYWLARMQESPSWTPAVAEKLRFIVNGWTIQADEHGYGAVARQEFAGGNYVDEAPYIGGWECGEMVGGDTVTEAGFDEWLVMGPVMQHPRAAQHAATRDKLAAEGDRYDLAIYESGPGYDLPGQVSPERLEVQQRYGKSLAAGVAYLDAMLYSSQLGYGPQEYFGFWVGSFWASHTNMAEGFRAHPSWLACEMRNTLAAGPMIETTVDRAPTRDVAQTSMHPELRDVPLIGAYAFRDGSQWTVFVISRKREGTTEVTVHLPFGSDSAVATNWLAGRYDSSNRFEETVWIRPGPPLRFARDLTFTLPASSVVALSFEATE